MVFANRFEKKDLRKSARRAKGAMYNMQEDGEQHQEQVQLVSVLKAVIFWPEDVGEMEGS